LVREAGLVAIRRPTSLVEAIRKQSVLLARDLANHISDQGLPEGTRLPTEQEMQQQFGVGRNTIREALRLLELRGVITIRSGRGGGPVVRRPRSSDLGEALLLVLQFQSATLTDIIDARILIEPMAASAAATSITEDALAKLKATNGSIRAADNDEANFSHQNSSFHSIIGECLGLPVITVLLDSLKSVHDGLSYGVHYPPERIRSIARAHQKIIDKVDAGDTAGAEAAMRRHLFEAKKYWESNYPQTCSQPLRWLGE
jgi:GntR family transcriptional regulator, transcriptional repressor for pyruvate dehydrogenase complex